MRWAPREVNREADRLANGDSSGFNPALRLAGVAAAWGDGSYSTKHWSLGETAENEKRKYLGRGGRSEARGRSLRTSCA